MSAVLQITTRKNFEYADLMRDRKMIPLVQNYARQIISQNPQLADVLIKRWLDEKTEYSNA